MNQVWSHVLYGLAGNAQGMGRGAVIPVSRPVTQHSTDYPLSNSLCQGLISRPPTGGDAMRLRIATCRGGAGISTAIACCRFYVCRSLTKD